MVSLNTLRMLFVTLIMVMVFCLPYFNDVGQHNDHHRFDVSFMHHDDGTLDDPSDHNEHKDIGHALTHCLTASCAPASFMAPNFLVDPGRGVLKEKYTKDKNLNVRSMYLSGDPPIPRGGFSNT